MPWESTMLGSDLSERENLGARQDWKFKNDKLWALQDSNLRPLPCEGSALDQLS